MLKEEKISEENITIYGEIVPQPIKLESYDEWRERYNQMNSSEIGDRQLEELAERMIQIAYTDKKVLTINDVYVRCAVTSASVDVFAIRSEAVADANTIALSIIGARRENMALLRKVDFATMKHMQGIYDGVWRKREAYLSSLRDKNRAGDTTKVVVIDRISSSKEIDEYKRRTKDTSK